MALADLEPGSAEWWLAVLEYRLRKWIKDTQIYRDYYDGKHNLMFVTEKFRRTFGDLLDALADNWCQLVVDVVAERLKVNGFRWGDETSGDAEAWAIWQANRMDAEDSVATTEALISGRSYALINPFLADGQRYPTITVEDPTQMIVAFEPGSRWERAAALKMWQDDYGATFATVYLPDGIYKFQATRPVDTKLILPAGVNVSKWAPREVGSEAWPLPNPLGVVPVVPLVNRPRMMTPEASELKVVIPNQDAVNTLLASMMVAGELGAFKQRTLTGQKLDKDPVTGKYKEPFDVAQDRLLWTDNPQARFGVLEASDLGNYVVGIKNRVESMSAQTRLPAHYFGLIGQWPSGEALRGAETGLVRLLGGKTLILGESKEEIIRLAFQAVGDPRGQDMSAETIWADPETRTQSELIDSLVKQMSMGVPTEVLWEKAGYTPQEIARMKNMRAEQALEIASAFEPAAPRLPEASLA